MSSASLKEDAVGYFRDKAAIYNERYSVTAAGDLLWVRHHAIMDMVRSWNLPPGSRFIDLGCGPGVLTRDIAKMGYGGTGLDASPAMIAACYESARKEEDGQPGWTYELGDVEAPPFPDGSFDAVTCSGVIDYLTTDHKLIAEAARLLKPGGRFVLCFTNKYGYTSSLSKPIHWLKKMPFMRSFASRLRSTLVGGAQGAMQFTFLPRKQRPSDGRAALRQHGFEPQGDRYVHFSLLPAPFCTMTSRLNFGMDEKLNRLDRTPLRVLGSCYIVDAQRVR